MKAEIEALDALLVGRRGFAVGVGAVLFARPKLIVSKVPILYGDGEHDDTEALNTLLAGKPVRTALSQDTVTPLFRDGWAALKGGSYWLSAPLCAQVPFYLEGLEVSLPAGIFMTKGFVPFGRRLPSGHSAVITNCHLAYRGPLEPDPRNICR